MSGDIWGVGERHNFCKLLLHFSFFSLLRKHTHATRSNSPCGTKSTKKLGAGDMPRGKRVTKASRSAERTGRKELILPWKTARKTGEVSDGAASGRCWLRRSLVAAVTSPSAPSANAFWGKGFRLLSYVQQAQTAKRFAKGSLPASSVRRRRL